MRRTLFATALTATVIGLSALGSGAAFAVEGDGYTPDTPTGASLAGSTVSPECHVNAPWIGYNVELTDPDDTITTTAAYLNLTDGTNSYDIPLGNLVDDKLSGSVLWPGAEVGADGKAIAWPGWEQVDGEWVETDGNFAWTRGAITATLHVNPEVVVPLTYPAASSACASPAGLVRSAVSSEGLALTGSTVSYVALGAGLGAVALGAGIMVARRRQNR